MIMLSKFVRKTSLMSLSIINITESMNGRERQREREKEREREVH